MLGLVLLVRVLIKQENKILPRKVMQRKFSRERLCAFAVVVCALVSSISGRVGAGRRLNGQNFQCGKGKYVYIYVLIDTSGVGLTVPSFTLLGE